MNPKHSEVKINTIFEIGAEIDDKLETTEKEVTLSEGAASALINLTKKMGEMFASVNADIEKGALNPAQAVIAKRYVTRCAEFVSNYAKSMEARYSECKGKAEAYTFMRDRAKSLYDQEKERLDNFNAAVERTRADLEAAATASVNEDQNDPQVKRRKRVPPNPSVARALGLPVGAIKPGRKSKENVQDETPAEAPASQVKVINASEAAQTAEDKTDLIPTAHVRKSRKHDTISKPVGKKTKQSPPSS